MRKFLALVFVLVCSPAFAQAATVRFQWDPPVAGDGTQSYNVTLDTQAPISVPATLDTTCNCVRTAPITVAVGAHTVKITTVYLYLSTDPTATAETAPITATFTINAGNQVKNVKITK